MREGESCGRFLFRSAAQLRHLGFSRSQLYVMLFKTETLTPYHSLKTYFFPSEITKADKTVGSRETIATPESTLGKLEKHLNN